VITSADIKEFVIEVFGGALGGWISEFVVTHPEIFGALGEWGTPVFGTIVGLGARYLTNKGTIPRELGKIIELAGAVATGNWIWEKLKTGFGGGGTSAKVTVRKGTSAIIYTPPAEAYRRQEFGGAVVV